MPRKPRIRGAVRAMNQLRARLAAGLPPAQQATFRAEVVALVTEIETICRKQAGRPEDLPAPSYRAYSYLQALLRADLPSALPEQRGEAAAGADPPLRRPPPGQARVSGLVATVDAMQEALWALAQSETAPAGPAQSESALVDILPPDPSVELKIRRLQEQLAAEVASVEAACREQGWLPIDLPVRSRRAYQWLALLAQPGRIDLQVEAMARVHRSLQDPRFRARLPRGWQSLPAIPRFYHQSRLLRSQVHPQAIDLEIHQALVGAQPADLADFAKASLLPRAQAASAHQRLSEWSRGEAFHRAMAELEALGSDLGEGQDAGRSSRASGAHHRLDESFARVNRDYFAGALELPQLAWNRTITHRMLGNYQSAADRITLSQTLDDPRVPAWFIDFVVYHEALHKHLGIPCQSGRRRAHTPEFRRLERRFARFDEAQAFMREMGGLLGLQ